MAYQQIKPFATCEYKRFTFVLDDDADLADLPETCAPGSVAVSVSSGNIFMKNASGAWKLFGGGE